MVMVYAEQGSRLSTKITGIRKKQMCKSQLKMGRTSAGCTNKISLHHQFEVTRHTISNVDIRNIIEEK